MRTNRLLLESTVLLSLFVVPFSSSSASAERGTLTGEVVEVRQAADTKNQGSFDEIKVRTRQNQESWLRLGPTDPTGRDWQVGDTVRACFLGDAGDGEAADAIRVHNFRTGRTDRIRTGDGTLLRQRDRDRMRDGSGDGAQVRERRRDRIHEPGTGWCDRSCGRGGRGGGR